MKAYDFSDFPNVELIGVDLVWDFALSADEMQRLTALDKNQRFANY